MAGVHKVIPGSRRDDHAVIFTDIAAATQGILPGPQCHISISIFHEKELIQRWANLYSDFLSHWNGHKGQPQILPYPQIGAKAAVLAGSPAYIYYRRLQIPVSQIGTARICIHDPPPFLFDIIFQYMPAKNGEFPLISLKFKNCCHGAPKAV